jgi:hypothetical protein
MKFEAVTRLLSEVLSEARLFSMLTDKLICPSDNDDSAFNINFSVGPGALDLFLRFMDAIYDIFEPSSLPLRHLHDEAHHVYLHLRDLPSDMLVLLKYLRRSIPRHLYDPTDGFRELISILTNHGDKLPVRSYL